jgi:nucleoside-diphosphate-sugar epimerase
MQTIPDTQFPQRDLEEILVDDCNLWEELRDVRLFLTGASGFFGRWLLESLLLANERLKLNVTVFALIRDTAAFARKAPHLADCDALHLLTGDVRDFAFPNGAFTHVVHLAANSDAVTQAADPLGLFAVIVDGTRRVLEFARHAGVKRFLFVSSGAVYGPQPPDLARIPENYQGAADCTNPQSVYGTAKRAAEQLCSLYNSVGLLEISIARAFAFVGPGMPLEGHFAVGNFIRDGIAGGPVKVNGDGTPLRSYLYAADLAWWLWKILLEGAPGRSYNVGGDEIVSIRGLAETVADSFSPCLSVTITRRPEYGKNPERYIPDITRAERELGLSIHIPLKEALRRTIAWHSQYKADQTCKYRPGYL